ncbi:HNH endonuclease [Streptomyces cacaoi]|uniref:HNH endonuclease n=1 Tax=Streptomyces cacaoi TaxID=1898 RepID=UPI0026341B2E|nr:HNH endonuclease signature motif containing protein [Streptomyces cacaoi]
MTSESPLADKKTRIAYNKELRAKGVPAKACGSCFAVKAFTQFNKCASKPDGRMSKCRDCHRAAMAKWNRENADRKRQWYEANAESQRAYFRRYYAENADAKREYARQWHAANPEKARAQAQRKRARKAAACVEDFTPAELFAAWEDAAIYDCYLCGLPFNEDDEVHLEHVVPISGGGTHEVANLLPAHARCNSMKHAADPLEAWQRVQRDTHGDAVAEARMRYMQAHTA